MRLAAKLYIGAVIATGAVGLLYALAHWQCNQPQPYLYCLTLALFASVLKVSLPGIPGSISVGYVFVLLALMEFSYPETLMLAALGIVVQSLHKAKVKPVQLVFNVFNTSNAVAAAYAVFHIFHGAERLLIVGAAAIVYFLITTVAIAGIVAILESRNLLRIWRETYFWTFPYYLIGGAIAKLISQMGRRIGWETTILALPVVYVIYRSYRLYLVRLESERQHAEQMAALHLRTIEALALAIEAKDETTHDHLQRVQVYALELGKKMKLEQNDLLALHAASILHDIGKLAVPEHIISKPGKLTAEEFEKMKIHPVVGAEILARVQFPYDVASVVRCHHEKWNGTGYPDGLREAQIPIGARILSAVDCLDALSSDRQYRRALPLDEAMAFVQSEAGKSYDPEVVRILAENYLEWERITRERAPQQRGLSRDVPVANSCAPAAGLASASAEPQQPEFLGSIAAARQEAQTLYELTLDLGNSLNLSETLSVLDARLRALIPYDTMAVWVVRDEVLYPQYVSGENQRLLASLKIPVGQGLSGWVAQTRETLINGNPSVESGYLNDPAKFSTLHSALSVHLEHSTGVMGVVTLYHAQRDAFTKDHLRVLLAVRPKLALTIENALQYQQAAMSATTDGLTGLPNARSLFLHLDGELTRLAAAGASVAVLVCDLDGFKAVNDRFGHLEGNKVLKLVGAGLRSCCRRDDYVARMGGDEFVLVLPGMSREDVGAVLAKMESIVVNAGVEVCGERVLNISVGSVFCPEDGTDAESLLAEADRRMYLIKKARKARSSPSAPALLALSNSLDAAETSANRSSEQTRP